MRRGLKIALAAAAAGAAAYGVAYAVGRTLSAPRHQGPVSDHFDGERFRNLAPDDQPQGSFLQWMATRRQGPWPEWLDGTPAPPPPERVGPGELRVTFVNHATVLIQFDGMNVLTDPIWSDRTSPVAWAGPRRRRPPGLRFEDLPPLDAVLVSHNHYDHLDVPTLRRIVAAHDTRVFVPLGNDLFLAEHEIGPAQPLDWWEARELPSGLRIHAVPARHFSSRGTADRNANLWGGFVLESRGGDAVYFAGDTGWGRHFEQIAARFPSIRLAILPIGAFLPRWFMSPVHIGPEDAIRAHQTLGARASMVMHFGTFPLGDDGMTEAPDLLARLLDEIPAGERPMIWIPPFAGVRTF